MAALCVRTLLVDSRFIFGKCLNLRQIFKPHVCALRKTSSETFTDEEKEFEERLNRIRDASGLDSFQKARLHGTVPPFDYEKMKYKKTTKRKFLRRVYALHGMASGKHLSSIKICS